ncbi:MAG TPA: hypothetical protein VGC54_01650 [Planctomycetota bacterium]
MIIAPTLLLFTAFPLLQGTDGDDYVLRLRDGRVLVGEVVRHDLDGLEVVSALDGGRYALPWGVFFPGEEERLKHSFGYRAETGPPLVAATQLLLKNGKQMIGRVLGRDEDSIRLRTGNTVVTVPLARLAAPPEEVRVPAPQVLTPEQFYAEQAPLVAADDALRQFEFAMELRSVFALEPALEHLGIAESLAKADGDNALLRRVSGARAALELTLAHREEAEALEQIRQLIHRERFAVALTALEDFGREYPDGGLRGEYLELEARFDEQRDEAMQSWLTRNWFNAVIPLLRSKALDRESTMDSIMEWAEETVPSEVRKRLLGDLVVMKEDLDESAVDALWQARFAHTPKRHQAGYGIGTWILGEERARKGLDVVDENADDGRSSEQKELEDRMRRYLENLERAKRSSGADDQVSPESWWRTASPTERFQWLLAYYAENSGDYQVTSVRFDNCRTCGGTGVLANTEVGSAGSREKEQRCHTCHGVAVYRAITFR